MIFAWILYLYHKKNDNFNKLKKKYTFQRLSMTINKKRIIEVSNKLYVIIKPNKFYKIFAFISHIFYCKKHQQQIMGNCVNLSKKTEEKLKALLVNNIQKIMGSQESITKYQRLSQQDSYGKLRKQINSLPNKQISYQDFLKMFPILSTYPDQRTRKIFSIFSIDENTITKEHLLIAIVIFQEVPSSVLQRIIFSLYCDNNNQQFEKQTISHQQIAKFSKENKQFKLRSEAQLVELQIQQLKHLIKTNECFTLQLFLKYFKKYYLPQSYRCLLQWNLQWKENELAKLINKMSPFQFKLQDSVYVVEYKWYLSWKNYMKERYQCDIQFLKLRNTQFNETKQYDKNNPLKRVQSRQINQTLKRQESFACKPKEIKNNILQGFYSNTLKRGLKQFRDFVFLPQQIWQQIYFIYSGGPIFKRSYPEIYSFTVIQVYVDQFGQFMPSFKNQALHFSESRKKRYKIKQIFQKDQYFIDKKIDINTVVCFIKPQGKSQWELINNFEEDVTNYLTRHRTFICFVPKKLKQTFQKLYNCNIKNKKEQIKSRITNYGSTIKISKTELATVIDIPNKEHVMIDYQDSQGVYQRKVVKISDIQDINPQKRQQQLVQQRHLAGLTNLGNTCYMNAIIQCLIATPCFGDYLQKQYSNISEVHSITSQLYQIFDKSRKSKEIIDTSLLKKKIDRIFPDFVGFSQQDTQQFLLGILTKIEQEINYQGKIKRINSIEDNSNFANGLFNSRLKRRETLQYPSQEDKFRFFSGLIESQTICTKCFNKGQINKQNFYTFSLSLPQHIQKQYYFTFIPKLTVNYNNWSPIQYGFTASNNIKFKDSVDIMSKILKISKDRLFVIAFTEGQWKTDYDQQTQLSEFFNFGMKIACYEVTCSASPTIQQYYRQNWQGKTAKIQIRQRYYENKSNKYKSIYIPLLLEINQKTKWQEIINSLQQILQQDNIELYSQKQGNIQINGKKQVNLRRIQSLLTYDNKNLQNVKSNPQKNESILENKQKKVKSVIKTMIKKYYKIRLIKKDNSDNNCFLCLKKLTTSAEDIPQTRIRKRQTFCQGCIPGISLLKSDEMFMRNISKVVLVINWQDNIIATNKLQKDQSWFDCQQKTKNRKDNIKELLQQQCDINEQIDLKCSKKNCNSNRAVKKDKLTKYPNIFILHLKRFGFFDQCFSKLMNPVIYTEKLTIDNITYYLYGVIIHSGSGTGGHYIALIKNNNRWYKCDDERVTLAKENEIINPDAYILFYKKATFNPTLIKLHF